MRTTKDNFRLFEDLARMAIGAAGSMTDVREQIKKLVKERLETVMSDMDMVSRSEFDRVKAMAEKARLRQEELEERLDALEGKGRSAAKTKKRKKAA
jgi:BMFP domain-containing protein YqiC